MFKNCFNLGYICSLRSWGSFVERNPSRNWSLAPVLFGFIYYWKFSGIRASICGALENESVTVLSPSQLLLHIALALPPWIDTILNSTLQSKIDEQRGSTTCPNQPAGMWQIWDSILGHLASEPVLLTSPKFSLNLSFVKTVTRNISIPFWRNNIWNSFYSK